MAARPALIQFAEALEEEAEDIRIVATHSSAGYLEMRFDSVRDTGDFMQTRGDFKAAIENIDPHLFRLSAISRRHPGTSVLNDKRRELVEATKLVRRNLRKVDEALVAKYRPFPPDVVLGSDEIEKRMKDFLSAFSSWQTLTKECRKLLDDEIEETWRKIRDLERFAVHA